MQMPCDQQQIAKSLPAHTVSLAEPTAGATAVAATDALLPSKLLEFVETIWRCTSGCGARTALTPICCL